MAKSVFRKFFKWFFITLNIFVCIAFLLACLAPYLNPAHWWLIGFLGLSVPYLIILLIFSIIFWLIIKPIFFLIPFFSLLIGWNQMSVLFATHFHSDFNNNKPNSVLRIVDWNVASMYGLSNDKEIKKHDRTEIANLILKQNPDIICLQEFNDSYTQGAEADNIGLFTSQFPYYFFSKDYEKRNGFYLAGSIIFSKYPIIDSGKIKYPGNIAESLIYIDVKKNNDTIRIYTLHLQSFLFKSNDYANMEKIKDQDQEALAASKNLFGKMKLAFTRRGIQAETVRTETDKSPYPCIVCGDFNDVPNSFTYFHIRGQRQDAFLAKSFGVGRTYIALAPTLRIDYILPDNNFNVHQFEMIDENLSDHLMLISDMSLKK
ncbi:MAG: endonuclease/exonuclease/phosphatase family protein [Chitinophagaceae bacterium]